MKSTLNGFFPLILFFIGIMACTADDSIVSNSSGEENNDNHTGDTTGNRLRVRIGSSTFTATLLNNATVTSFKASLPMTVPMSELNGNEKLYRFANNLPTNASNPATIHTGDLMIYGSNTLVLFYQTFPTPYSYTKLGRIDNTSGLAAAVGAGNVTVTFELD
jgi:hypothetical protein